MLKKLSKEEAEKEDKPVDTINEKENIYLDKIKYFQDKTRFN